MASELQVTTIRGVPTGANANQIVVPTGQTLAAPGHIIQVVSTTKTDTFVSSATGPIDIPGLSVTITPKFATSKIFIMFNAHIVGFDSGTGIRILRGSTNLGLANTAGAKSIMTAIGFYSNGQSPNSYSGGNTSMSFLDSPSTTSATTYKLQAQCLSTAGIFINKSRYDIDNGNASRGSSTITLMEVAQ